MSTDYNNFKDETVYISGNLIQKRFLDTNENFKILNIIVVNIKDETIKQNDLVKNLDESDIYVFRSLLDEVEINDQLVDDVLQMKYMQTYLSQKLSLNELPRNSIINSLFVFSSIVIPYQNIDYEIIKRKTYKNKFLDIFYKNNNRFFYNIKSIFRYVLLIPGLIMSPIIIGFALYGLSKMN